MTTLRIERCGPLCTVQDAGRFGHLAHGVSASGPMDRTGFANAAAVLGGAASSGIELTSSGIALTVLEGSIGVGFAGGDFRTTVNEGRTKYPGTAVLDAGDRLDIQPGPSGNFGYLRFNAEIDVPVILGSRATNMRFGLGGLAGRALANGDIMNLLPVTNLDQVLPQQPDAPGPVRVLWGLHADLFSSGMRVAFLSSAFSTTASMDRMGMRLADPDGVFGAATNLTLVSDAVTAGDIQILGDGTPIILMRDHQPTGGYPRIATVIERDIDRVAQMRPGTPIHFQSVSLSRAQHLQRGSSR